MGAVFIRDSIMGFDHTKEGMNKAFNHLSKQAVELEGDDPYNGTISTVAKSVLATGKDGKPVQPVHSFDINSDPYFIDNHEQLGASKWSSSAAVPVYEYSNSRCHREVFEVTRRVGIDEIKIFHSSFLGKPFVKVELPQKFLGKYTGLDIAKHYRGRKDKPEKVVSLMHQPGATYFTSSSSLPAAVMEGKKKLEDLKTKTVEVTYTVNTLVVDSYGSGEKETGWVFFSIAAE